MTKQEKYAKYSFEEFIQDDFFVESMKRPTEEGLAFWNRFLEDYPEQSEIYRAARTFMEDLTRPQIADKEINDLWTNLQAKIKSTRQWGKIRRITYYSTAVAASIAVLLLVRMFLLQNDATQGRENIMDFVVNHAAPTGNSKDIQLILSDQKTVYLQDKEPVIVYDSIHIHTNSETISTNEIASYNQLKVPYGKRSVLSLHDGTKIWINSATCLTYPIAFEKYQREIYVNGEIFLDVAPDAKRPFIVRTDDMRIQVVGTRFNVQAYSSDKQSIIALESGLVKITSGNTDELLLKPNKIYEQDKVGRWSVKDADVGKYTSWIHGLYAFQSEQLGVILKRLERYYGKTIVVEPPASELKCSGKLDLKDNLEDVLSIICKTAQVKYVNDGEKYIIKYQPLKNMPMRNK